MFGILRDFRRLVEAVQNLVLVLVELLQVQREAGPALDRLSALELARAKFEAEMEGMVLKAEGKYKAANNAEARERQLKKSYERDSDEIDFSGQEPETPEGDPVLDVDAQAGEAERVQSLRLDVAPVDGRALALMRKWQR